MRKKKKFTNISIISHEILHILMKWLIRSYLKIYVIEFRTIFNNSTLEITRSKKRISKIYKLCAKFKKQIKIERNNKNTIKKKKTNNWNI